MDSIYPSSTVQVKLSDQDDDDVSTLSGGSCTPQLSHNRPPPISLRKIQRGSLKPYLNGTLPANVNAMLNERSGGYIPATNRIPSAIKINLLDNGPEKDASDEKLPVEVFEQSKVDTQKVKVMNSTNSRIDSAVTYGSPASRRSRNSKSRRKSPTSRRRSPAINAARRQRLLRLRRRAFGNDGLHSSSFNPIRRVPPTAGHQGPNQLKTTNKNEITLKRNQKEACEISKNDLLTIDKRNGTSLTKGKITSQTSPSRKTAPISNDSAKPLVSPTRESSKIIHNSPGRIHRSFWSVPAPPKHVQTFSPKVHSSSTARFTTTTSATKDTTLAPPPITRKLSRKEEPSSSPVSGISRLLKDYESDDAPSMSSALPSKHIESPNSNAFKTPPATPGSPSILSIISKHTPLFRSPDNSGDDNSPSKASKSSMGSMKSFDEFYNEVIEKLKNNKFSSESKQDRHSIAEPPVLNRILLGTKNCLMGDCNGMSDIDDSSSEKSSILDNAKKLDAPKEDCFENVLDGKSRKGIKPSMNTNSTNSMKERTSLDSMARTEPDHPNVNTSEITKVKYPRSTHTIMLEHTVQDNIHVKNLISRDDQEQSTIKVAEKINSERSVASPGKLNNENAGALPFLQGQQDIHGNISVSIQGSPKCDHSITTVHTPTTASETIDTSVTSEHYVVKERRYKRNENYHSNVRKQYKTMDAEMVQTFPEREKSMPNKKLRKNLLLTPTTKIMKKLRKVTGRTLRKKTADNERTHSLDYDDEEELLPRDEWSIDQDFHEISTAEDEWFETSFFTEELLAELNKNSIATS